MEDAVESIVKDLLKIITELSEDWMASVSHVFFDGRTKENSDDDVLKEVSQADREILQVVKKNYTAVLDNKKVDHAEAYNNYKMVQVDWDLAMKQGLVNIMGPVAFATKARSEDMTGEPCGFTDDVTKIILKLYVRRNWQTNVTEMAEVTIGQLDDLAGYVHARRHGLGLGLDVPPVFAHFIQDEASIRRWWWCVWAELLHGELHQFTNTYTIY